MLAERHVRLFRNGRNQAVRIPREFEFDADEIIMRREEGRLVLEPLPRRGLLDTLARLQPLNDAALADWDAGLLPLDDVSL
ncbi:antitoxin [Comamonas flocculans]|uniref:AbrB/MazE/SpoVT family DNA-binding domain-containing protein n=1 Tax=Comamonas flocculans TaxID=2597701 RepID=A0A5B8RVW3_9BURK|nr:AbrB/MazE/SpoVT family DNA-binding domain-containing protein [Comamonas flocculans]QEA13273.1 AbrB/MazE/SpoVT family DNA-binding domain-containing protein [Comamonas flocculans]